LALKRRRVNLRKYPRGGNFRNHARQSQVSRNGKTRWRCQDGHAAISVRYDCFFWTSIALSAIVWSVNTAPGVTRIFKGKSFERFASPNDIEDQDLVAAIERAENGLIDADLGAGLIKQRLARGGQGKSGSFRAAIFFRSGGRAVFIHGFAK